MKQLVFKIINREQNEIDAKVLELDVILMISGEWNDLSATTIKHCFHHDRLWQTKKQKRQLVKVILTQLFSEEDIHFVKVDAAARNLRKAKQKLSSLFYVQIRIKV